MKKLGIFLHFFVGIGALAGGFGGLLHPDAPMGITPDVLHYGPFTNFFIPSLFLFLILGVGNIFLAIIAIRKKEYTALCSLFMGSVLSLWIIIQCLIMWSVAPIQAIFFVIGLVQIICGASQKERFLSFR